MTKKIVTTIAVTFIFIACNNHSNETKTTVTKTDIVSKSSEKQTTNPGINDFVGIYISGQKEDGNDWVEIEIENLEKQDSCKITVDTKVINGRKNCTFQKVGIYKNDTIFINTTDWKKPVTVILTRKDNKITFDAIEKEDGDRYVLNYYCNGGGSLIGDYTKK